MSSKFLHGGRGGRAVSICIKEGTALINDTGDEYEISSSYQTVACGAADRITVQPGEAAYLCAGGGPRDFATWEICPKEEIPGTIRSRMLSEIKHFD